MIRNGKIELLQNIIIDDSLPKHKIEKVLEINESDSSGFNPINGSSGWSSITSVNSRNDNVLEYLEYIHANCPTFLIKFKIWLYKKIYSKHIGLPKDKKNKFSLNELKNFFDSIKSNISKLNKGKIDDILNNYTALLENAEKNNQIALIERIKDYAEVLKYDAILSVSKFNKFLTEEDIVKFYNVASVHEKYNTGLCLTYVKNFIKIIPEEITKLKTEADKLKVFDNYVILHYDYYQKSTADTKKEIEKKKDPILFGVIKNSTNLYYIGDWIDEYCDLTLDVIIKKIGKKSKEIIINSESIKNNINKI